VDAYLEAVEAGLPMTEVAHHLARVYRVDIASILPSNDLAAEDAAPPEPAGIAITTYLPPAPAADLGAAAEPKDVPPAERAASRSTF
jgi:hypothetical protein